MAKGIPLTGITDITLKRSTTMPIYEVILIRGHHQPMRETPLAANIFMPPDTRT